MALVAVLRRCSRVALLCLLLPVSARAQGLWGRGQGELYSASERSSFVIGGMGWWSRDLSFGTTWSLGAGMELPMNSWAVVPRMDIEGNSSESAGGFLVRATVGGRLTTLIANHATYVEGGMGALRSEITQDLFDGTQLTDTVVSPCFVIVIGTMSDPELRPSLMLEGEFSHPADRKAPGSMLGRVGIRF